MHHKKLQKSELETAKSLMCDCFATPAYFNDAQNIPTVQDILQNCPMIFNKECLFGHFEKLMDLDIRTFKSNFEKSRSKLQKKMTILL